MERSPRTDDEKFYIPGALTLFSEDDLLNQAQGYVHYNNLREHSSLGYQTPFHHLKKQMPQIDDRIRFGQSIIFEDVAVKLGPWSEYNVLA